MHLVDSYEPKTLVTAAQLQSTSFTRSYIDTDTGSSKTHHVCYKALRPSQPSQNQHTGINTNLRSQKAHNTQDHMHTALLHSCLHRPSTLVRTEFYRQGVYYSQSPVHPYKYNHNNIHTHTNRTTRNLCTSKVPPIGQLYTTDHTTISVMHVHKHHLLLTVQILWLLSIGNFLHFCKFASSLNFNFKFGI